MKRTLLYNAMAPVHGILLFLMVYAAFKTDLHTQLFAAAPLLIYLFSIFKPQGSLDLGKFLFGWLFSSAALTYPFWKHFFANRNGYFLLKGDMQFYSRIAEFIHARGVESTKIDYINKEVGGHWYHYTELWTGSAIGHFTGLHFDIALVLALFVVLWGVLYYSLNILTLQFTNNKNMAWLLPLIFPVLGTFPFLYPQFISVLSQDIYDVPFMSQPKTVVVSIMAVWTVLAFRLQNFPALITLLALVGILYFPVLPASCMAIALCVIVFFIEKRKAGNAFSVRFLTKNALLPLGIIAISLMVLFNIHEPTKGLNQTSESVLSLWLNDWNSGLKTAFNIVVKTTIGVVISLSLFVAFIVIGKVKVQWRVVLYIAILYFSGIAMWAFFHTRITSVQLWSNLFFPFIHVIIFVILALAAMNRRRIVVPAVVALFVYGVFFKSHQLESEGLFYNGADIDALSEKLHTPVSYPKHSESTLLLFYEADWKSIKSEHLFSVNVYPPMNELRLFGKLSTICTNLGNMPMDANKSRQSLIDANPTTIWKLNHPGSSIKDELCHQTSFECVDLADLAGQ